MMDRIQDRILTARNHLALCEAALFEAYAFTTDEMVRSAIAAQLNALPHVREDLASLFMLAIAGCEQSHACKKPNSE